MAKQKSKSSKNLNLRNPRQIEVIRSFSLCEGRMSKEDILSVGTKDIFYQMKNNGFIKETVKGSGVYKATGKLQNLSAKHLGSDFGIGCSNKHSQVILKSKDLIPKSIIEDCRFNTGNEIKKQMQQFKESEEYRQHLETLKHENIRQKEVAYIQYQDVIASGTKTQMLQAELAYKDTMDALNKRAEILDGGNPLFLPDYSVKATREELQEMLCSMQECLNRDDMSDRETAYMQENTEKLQELISTMESVATVYFEAVTNHYGQMEMEKHLIFEQMTGNTVLYVM